MSRTKATTGVRTRPHTESPPDHPQAAYREHLAAGMRMEEKLIATASDWIAMCADDPRPAFQHACEVKRRSVGRRTAQL